MFPIFIPPLRARRSDILPLADHFAQKYASQHGKTIKRISTPAIDQLACYHWPGNVRELENTIERAVLMADGEVIHGHHLPPTLQTAEATGTVVSASLGGAVATFERSLIEDALKTTRGNRSKAARLAEHHGAGDQLQGEEVRNRSRPSTRLRREASLRAARGFIEDQAATPATSRLATSTGAAPMMAPYATHMQAATACTRLS